MCSGLELFGSSERLEKRKYQQAPPEELLCGNLAVKPRSTKLTEEKLTRKGKGLALGDGPVDKELTT